MKEAQNKTYLCNSQPYPVVFTNISKILIGHAYTEEADG